MRGYTAPGAESSHVDLAHKSGYVGHVKTANISYTKNNLSALLELVKRGETVTILDRTRPVARLTPIPSTGDEALDRRLDDLERRGIIKRGSGESLDWLLREPPPKPKSGFSITQALIDMRNEDR